MKLLINEKTYFFGKNPMLKAKTKLKKLNMLSDFECEVELFDTMGNKLMEFVAYVSKSEGKSLSKEIICYDDFFVIDSHITDKNCGIDRCFFRAYDYKSNLIYADHRKGFRDGDGYKKVRTQQKYNLIDQNSQM